ncbi:hypothetical protein DERP_006011 [Dermatophagoides pteronyssinus]|uniref:Uncharacterized protein n=1 Tax=Dermatophagoides pteronyssinus TaxID=6956 RepID=A0ABQ8JSN1_DERPT|nr:hypothetical protein DERP_006011 [Dermatophagoides pteronyssinus]
MIIKLNAHDHFENITQQMKQQNSKITESQNSRIPEFQNSRISNITQLFAVVAVAIVDSSEFSKLNVK